MTPPLSPPISVRSARMIRARGFTLIEVLIATALLAFSLAVMFGFHAQAVRSNRDARKVTECTYLAQSQLEELMALQWDDVLGRPTEFQAGANSTGGYGSFLFHSDNGPGADPTAVDALGGTTGAARPTYFVSWDIEDMNTSQTWIRIRVRCAYEDAAFGTWNGATISSYRYKDI